ncbi:MAG: hypothetical protein H6581_13425 [Bacteroidia bacterium]|nr:hypothetical protein [Bacteroidia bacterium]
MIFHYVNFRNAFFSTLAFFLLLITSQQVKASHAMGADLTYECILGNQYRIRLKLWRDCSGVQPLTSQTVTYSSATCGVNSSISLPMVGTKKEITPLCPSQTSTCNNGSAPGIEEFTYQATVNLPLLCSANDWIFGWSVCCRNGAITTLNSAASQSMYVSARLSNQGVLPCNDSPVFNNVPTATVCVGNQVNYNHGATDANGDSLVFSLVNCLQSATTQVTYNGGFSGSNPLTASPAATIDPVTGNITFTPTQVQVGVLCVRVEEFRNGVKIGEVTRDMQFRVVACANNPPVATGMNGTNVFDTTICAGANLCFGINMSDPNANLITASWNNGIPTGLFTLTGNGTTTPSAQFCWTPTTFDLGTHFFTLTLKDDACPVVGVNTFTYTIHVIGSPQTISAGPDVTICAGDTVQLNGSSSGASSYTWTPNTNINNSALEDPLVWPNVSTVYTLTGAFPDGCVIADNVTVTVAAAPPLAVTPKVAWACPGGNVLLSAVAPTAVSYSWSSGGTGAQTIVSPGSTTTYCVTVTDAGGCTNTDCAQIRVDQPNFTGCNVIYASPTGTGIGTQGDPANLSDAIDMASCNNTVVKMAIGTYTIDTTITNIRSYITLEGGFDPSQSWRKTSQAGATTILRTALNPAGALHQQRIVAISMSSATNFRFQDLTIQVADATPVGNGASTYGVHMDFCSDYDIIRTQVFSGVGATGATGSVGSTGAAGGNGANGGNGSDNGCIQYANGGNGGTSPCGCPGGRGGGNGWADCGSRPGQPGLAGSCGGGAGGAGKSNQCDWPDCTNDPDGSCSGWEMDGCPGGAGSLGPTGAIGAGGPAGTISTFYVPGGQASTGATGGCGTGGGGGGGGAAEQGGFCDDGSGASAGGGGGGGAGGTGGTGGRGGGGSFCVFLLNNGANSIIDDCNFLAGGPGNGGAGGAGGAGGNGGSGGIGGTGNCDVGWGGNGGVGGKGGTGGQGGTGAAGIAGQLMQMSGTSVGIADFAFNLAGQPTIFMSNTSCTNSPVTFSTGVSGLFTFGSGSSPASATGTSVITSYSSTGRKNITYTGNSYQGFANIIQPDTLTPSAGTSAPFVAGNYRICAGDVVNFFALNGGPNYIYTWDMGGGAVGPNSYSGIQYDSLNSIQWNVPGVYYITLRFSTDCCGLTSPDTIELHVEVTPSLAIAGPTAFCLGDSSGVTLTASGGASYLWAPVSGVTPTTGPTVVAKPSVTSTYLVTAFNTIGNCSDNTNVTVTVNDVQIATNAVAATCGPNGSLSALASNGSGSYSYFWPDIPSNLANNAGLLPGTYRVLVTDLVTGCVDSSAVVIPANPSTPTASVNTSTPVSCNGDADGSAVVTVANGTGPYSYLWSPSGGTIANPSGLVAGNYSVTVTDFNGCVAVANVSIPEPGPLLVEAIDSLPSCINTDSGMVSVNASGGTGPFIYNWVGMPLQTGMVVTNLTAGIYKVIVTDQKGCVDSVSVRVDTINSPCPPLAVEMLYFTANPLANFIQLDWQTVVEEINRGFEVQRGTDLNNFINIGWVESKFASSGGNSSVGATYSFDDRYVEPGQTYYYRLQEVDMDGRTAYSQVREARLPDQELLHILNFYPHPVMDIGKLDIYLPQASRLDLELVTLSGQGLGVKTYELSEGMHTLEVNFSDLAAGMYIGKVKINGKAVANLKVFKAR